MKFIKAGMYATSSVSFGLIYASSTLAACTDSTGVLGGACQSKPNSTPSNLFSGTGGFHTIADILIYIVGAVAVIMLIIGGARYVISQGSSDQVKQAKDTILYAIIGIVVAILAYAIVQFIAGSLTKNG